MRLKRAYLTVCIKRMMLDHQNHLWGKWRSSTEASRLGEVAIRLENLLRRDGFSFREAVAILQINDKVELSEQELDDLATRLPPKTPPRRMERDAGLLNLPAQDNPDEASFNGSGLSPSSPTTRENPSQPSPTER